VTISSRAQELLGVALPRATPHVFFVDGERRLRVVEAWRSGGHTRRRTLGPLTLSRFDLPAAITPAGGLLIANDIVSRREGRRLVILSRRPGGRLRMARVPLRGRLGASTTVALARSGNGLVVTRASPRRLTLRSVDRLGHVGRARVIRTRRASGYTAAIDRSGAGVLAATLYGGTGTRRRDRVVAWRLLSGGRVGPRHTLYPPGGYVTGPLGATTDGRVTWLQRQGVYAALVR
jgi:hypothetical protein